MTKHPRKPQPWFASLNQPPRSPKHGRNRKPPAPTYRDPTNRTDHDPRANDIADSLAYSQWAFSLYSERPQPPIPHAGIRAGELTGHRLWFVVGGNCLCSFAHHFIWKPNTVIEGNVDSVVEQFAVLGGVYAFNTFDRMAAEFYSYGFHDFPTSVIFLDHHVVRVHGIVGGTIKMWGEVVEHQYGYRAQYAKLTSLNLATDDIYLQALRSKYNV